MVGANQALTAQTVQFGTVTSARNVVVQGGQGSQLAGAVLGGVAGAALGNQVGGGTGQDIATVVGGTAGRRGRPAGRPRRGELELDRVDRPARQRPDASR